MMEFSDDPHPDSPVEWENNWLSNTMAAASTKLVPNWCATPEHWTSRFTQILWTDCPCCLALRGVVVGIPIGMGLGAVLTFLIVLALP